MASYVQTEDSNRTELMRLKAVPSLLVETYAEKVSYQAVVCLANYGEREKEKK